MLEELLQALPWLRPQIYFKSSLIALSHAIEDQVLAGEEGPLVIACFQKERFYRQEAQRYRRIGSRSEQVYVLASPETEFKNSSGIHESIAFAPTDGLALEWHLVVIAKKYAACLACREKEAGTTSLLQSAAMDQARSFDGIWTFDRRVSCTAANLLLNRILAYRPELAEKVNLAKALLQVGNNRFNNVDPGPFGERLVTYLQASQYKLMKTYRSLAAQERRERLVNTITMAIRRSLNPSEIFQVSARELGLALNVCRCLIYRCKATDNTANISHEFLRQGVSSLEGQTWLLKDNPLFQEVVGSRETAYTENAQTDSRFLAQDIRALVSQWQIGSWVMVPVLYQSQMVGMMELHDCSACQRTWETEELALVEAIAAQVGIALIQAEAYANLENLNQQLEALEQTRSNLIAITGHELRTPLSTIQVCLESLAGDPDMPPAMRQVMLSTALTDAERLRTLVQDFLTLSHLESGRVEWNLEPLSLQECVDLALSSIRHRRDDEPQLPQIKTQVPKNLPLVRADGEWLVEVLSKLLDNACKFTPAEGRVTVAASLQNNKTVEVLMSDTGRGIPPERLETVFDRFYQEEGALRRTQGGTGLGLAICRQIVTGWGGEIWATSEGLDSGSQFHFTIPIVNDSQNNKTQSPSKSKGRSKKRPRSNNSRQGRKGR